MAVAACVVSLVVVVGSVVSSVVLIAGTVDIFYRSSFAKPIALGVACHALTQAKGKKG